MSSVSKAVNIKNQNGFSVYAIALASVGEQSYVAIYPNPGRSISIHTLTNFNTAAGNDILVAMATPGVIWPGFLPTPPFNQVVATRVMRANNNVAVLPTGFNQCASVQTGTLTPPQTVLTTNSGVLPVNYVRFFNDPFVLENTYATWTEEAFANVPVLVLLGSVANTNTFAMAEWHIL